jgi:hypothetical protein
MTEYMDLFGSPIPARFPGKASNQGGLFGGDAWVHRANEWAKAHGLVIEKQCLNQSFKVSPGGWFRAAWNEDNERWEIDPCAPEGNEP